MSKKTNWKKTLRALAATTILAGGVAVSSTGCANMNGYGYGGQWAGIGHNSAMEQWNNGNASGAVYLAGAANQVGRYVNDSVRDSNYTARDSTYTAAYNAEQTFHQVEWTLATGQTALDRGSAIVKGADNFFRTVRDFNFGR